MPRVKTYDREEVLAKAMWVFWEKGYLGTSMQDLVEGMGIIRFSIYDSFHSKEKLFLLALQKYRLQILSAQLAILKDSSDGLESISVYFSSLVGLYTSGKVPPKCLMAATISEFGRKDPEVLEITGGCLTDLIQGFVAALGRARQQNEISDSTHIPAMAKFLTGLAQGLAIFASTVDSNTLKDLISQVPEVLKVNN